MPTAMQTAPADMGALCEDQSHDLDDALTAVGCSRDGMKAKPAKQGNASYDVTMRPNRLKRVAAKPNQRPAPPAPDELAAPPIRAVPPGFPLPTPEADLRVIDARARHAGLRGQHSQAVADHEAACAGVGLSAAADAEDIELAEGQLLAEDKDASPIARIRLARAKVKALRAAILAASQDIHHALDEARSDLVSQVNREHLEPARLLALRSYVAFVRDLQAHLDLIHAAQALGLGAGRGPDHNTITGIQIDRHSVTAFLRRAVAAGDIPADEVADLTIG